MYDLLFQILFSPFLVILFFLGYSWTTQADNVDTVLAALINNLQDQKLDKDGTIAWTGECNFGAHSAGFTEQAATGDGTTTIDWRLGNKFFFTFGNANETFTFTAPTKPCNLLLVLKQYSTGGKTATWPGTVKWPAGTAPTLSTGNNDVDIVSFYYAGDGNYYGQSALDFS